MSIPASPNPNRDQPAPFTGYYKVIADADGVKVENAPKKGEKNRAYKTLSAIEANVDRLKNKGSTVEYVQVIHDKYMDKYETYMNEYKNSWSKTWNDFLNHFRSAPKEPAATKKMKEVEALYQKVMNKLYTPASRPQDQTNMIKILQDRYHIDPSTSYECVGILSTGLDERQRSDVFQHLIVLLDTISREEDNEVEGKFDLLVNKIVQYGPLIRAMPTEALRVNTLNEFAYRSRRQDQAFKNFAYAFFDLDPENPGTQDLMIRLTAQLVYDGYGHNALDYLLPFADFSTAERAEILSIASNFKLEPSNITKLQLFLGSLAPEERIPALTELKKHALGDGNINQFVVILESFPKADKKQAFDQMLSQVKLLDAPYEAPSVTPNLDTFDRILNLFPEEDRLTLLKLLMTHIPPCSIGNQPDAWRILPLVLNRIAPNLREETLKKLLESPSKLSLPRLRHIYLLDHATKILSNLFLEDAHLMRQSYAWMIGQLRPLLTGDMSNVRDLKALTQQMASDAISRQNILTVLKSIPEEDRNKAIEGLNPAFCRGKINQSPWKLPEEFALNQFRPHLHVEYQRIVVEGSTDYFPDASQPYIETLQLFPSNDLPKVFKNIVFIPPFSSSSLKGLQETLQILPKEQRAESLAIAVKLVEGGQLEHLREAVKIVQLFPCEARAKLLNEQTISAFYKKANLYFDVLKLLPENQRLAAIETVPEMNQSLKAFIEEGFLVNVTWDNILKDLRLLPEELRFPTLKNLITQIKESIEHPNDPIAVATLDKIKKCKSSGDTLLFLFEQNADLKQKTMRFIQDKLEAFSTKNHANTLTASERLEAHAFAVEFLEKGKKLGFQRKNQFVLQAQELLVLCDPNLRTEQLAKDLESCAQLFPAEQRAGLQDHPDLLVALKNNGLLTQQILYLFPIEERLAQLKLVREIQNDFLIPDGPFWKDTLLDDLRILPPKERFPTYQKLRALEEKSNHIKERLAEIRLRNPNASIEDLNLPEKDKIQPQEQKIVDSLANQEIFINQGVIIGLLFDQNPELRQKARTYQEERFDVLLADETPINEASQAEAKDLIQTFYNSRLTLTIDKKDPFFIKLRDAEALYDEKLMDTISINFKEAEALFPVEERATLHQNKNLLLALKFFPAVPYLKLIPKEKRLAALPLLLTYSREVSEGFIMSVSSETGWKEILANLQVIPEALRMNALNKALEIWKASPDPSIVFPRILTDSPDLIPQIKTFLNQKMGRSLALESPELIPEAEREQLLELSNRIIKMKKPPNLLQIEEPLLQKAQKLAQLLSAKYAKIAPLFPLANRLALRENKEPI